MIELPKLMPEPFDLVKSCAVHKDCSIRFEGRTYIVPFRYVGQQLEVRGCAGFIQIADRKSGEVVAQYERGTEQRILIDPRYYEGQATERVEAPKPLGRMGRKLQEIMELPVQKRPLDLYAAGGGGAMRIYQTRKLLSEGVLPAPAPVNDAEGLKKRLSALGLEFAAEVLTDRLTEYSTERSGPCEFLDGLLRTELERREERRIRLALKISGLPTGQTISNFDFAFQPAIERSRIETLATCGWIGENHTLLIQGPPGVGKTHLAVALGVKAIECGFSVCFYRLEDLLHTMKKHAEFATERLKHKKYMAANLLIVDEMGFQAMSREEANLFFRLVSYRYQRGAICITTNKGIKDWPETFAGDEVLATAVLDRLLHASHVLNVKGRSYRLRDLEESLRLKEKEPVREEVAAPIAAS